MKKSLFMIALIFLIIGQIFAQTTIMGQVKNSAREPIPGAIVIIKGTTNGTVTDVPFDRTIATSHLPVRQGIFFAGIYANEGKHAVGGFSMFSIKDCKYEYKDWRRLQIYQDGKNDVLAESVNDISAVLISSAFTIDDLSKKQYLIN
jgi:hypothetical protein